jgi:hypothetical protein
MLSYLTCSRIQSLSTPLLLYDPVIMTWLFTVPLALEELLLLGQVVAAGYVGSMHIICDRPSALHLHVCIYLPPLTDCAGA